MAGGDARLARAADGQRQAEGEARQGAWAAGLVSMSCQIAMDSLGLHLSLPGGRSASWPIAIVIGPTLQNRR